MTLQRLNFSSSLEFLANKHSLMSTHARTHTLTLQNIPPCTLILTIIMFVMQKTEILQHRLHKEEDFIQNYYNREEKLNTSPLKQKGGGFVVAGVRSWRRPAGHTTRSLHVIRPSVSANYPLIFGSYPPTETGRYELMPFSKYIPKVCSHGLRETFGIVEDLHF